MLPPYNFAAGESLPAIMQAYRWRDARTVMRYGERLAAKSGASARMAVRFSKYRPRRQLIGAKNDILTQNAAAAQFYAAPSINSANSR